MGSQETTAWPLALASALKLAGPSPQPRMRPPRSASDRANMRRYSSNDRPQGMTSLSRMATSSLPPQKVGGEAGANPRPGTAMNAGRRSLDEAAGPPPLAAEDELGQGLPPPWCEVTLPEPLGQRGRVCGVADRQAGHGLHALGDAVQLTGPVGQDADHLVDGQAPCRRLQRQGGAG